MLPIKLDINLPRGYGRQKPRLKTYARGEDEASGYFLLGDRYLLPAGMALRLVEDLKAERQKVRDKLPEAVRRAVKTAARLRQQLKTAEALAGLANTAAAAMGVRLHVDVIRRTGDLLLVTDYRLRHVEPLPKDGHFEAEIVDMATGERQTRDGTFYELVRRLSGSPKAMGRIKTHVMLLPTVRLAPGNFGKTTRFQRLAKVTMNLKTTVAPLTVAAITGALTQGKSADPLGRYFAIVDEATAMLNDVLADPSDELTRVLLDKADPANYLIRRRTGFGVIDEHTGTPISFTGGIADAMDAYGFIARRARDKQYRTRRLLVISEGQPRRCGKYQIADLSVLLEAFRQARFRYVYYAAADRLEALSIMRRIAGLPDPAEVGLEPIGEIADVELPDGFARKHVGDKDECRKKAFFTCCSRRTRSSRQAIGTQATRQRRRAIGYRSLGCEGRRLAALPAPACGRYA